MNNGQFSYSELHKLKKKLQHPPVVEQLTFIIHPSKWHLVCDEYPDARGKYQHTVANVTFVIGESICG